MDKQTAIDLLDNLLGMIEDNHDSDYDTAIKMGIDALKEKTQLFKEDATKDATFDCISRKAAIDAVNGMPDCPNGYSDTYDKAHIIAVLEDVPSAQPERTCVSCGRTINNGGWYADGGTRCPIEEHYALPKDGYCHLWEKRNVTDDDYPERREE